MPFKKLFILLIFLISSQGWTDDAKFWERQIVIQLKERSDRSQFEVQLKNISQIQKVNFLTGSLSRFAIIEILDFKSSIKNKINVNAVVIKLQKMPGLLFAFADSTLKLFKTFSSPYSQFDSSDPEHIANPILRIPPVLLPAPPDVVPPIADPRLSWLWGMKKVGAVESWSLTQGSRQIKIAVIDSGVDYNHNDLAANIWRNPNPKTGDVIGFDFTNDSNLPFDFLGHGTHVSGIIGAVEGNGILVAGVIPQVSMMILRVFNGNGEATESDILRAFGYAIDHDAKVINGSWGFFSNAPILQSALEMAKEAKILVVVAAGNSGREIGKNGYKIYPPSFEFENVITVAGSDEKDRLCGFSNYSSRFVQISAPCEAYSTTPYGLADTKLGTSMAAPFVTGAAALILAIHPDWDYEKLKDTILKSVDPSAQLTGKVSSGGRLNILRALHLAHNLD